MDSKTKRSQAIVGTNSDGGRPEDDFYPTPPEVTRALLRVVPFFPNATIWEPACGNGMMSEVLKSTGCQVVSTDLNDRDYGTPDIDFLDTDQDAMKIMGLDPDHAAIITNPPFKLAYDFIDHAINELHVDELWLLMKLIALEGNHRSRLLESTRLSRVLIFRDRIKLTRNGADMKNSGMMAFAWFGWHKNWEGRPHIEWITSKE